MDHHRRTAGHIRPASQTKTTRAGGTSNQVTKKMKKRRAQRRKKEKLRLARLLHQQRSVLRQPEPRPATALPPVAAPVEVPSPQQATNTFPIRGRRRVIAG